MKKIPFKRLLALGLVGTLSFTLSACGKADYNTAAPYGTITGNYATDGDTILTNKQLYDMLRPSSYTVFYNEIESLLLKSYVDDIDFNNVDDRKEMSEYLNELIFETDDIEEINDLKADQEALDLKLKQLSDSMYSSGIVFDSSDITITSTEVQYPEVLFNYFKLNLAKERFGVEKLEELVDKEEIADPSDDAKEGDMIDNPNYISEKDIENYYNNTYINEQDFNAIIVGFNSLSDYERVMDEANFEIQNNLEYSEHIEFVDLYNAAYSYKKQLTWAGPSSLDSLLENTIVNSEVLANYNSDLASFVNNMEAGQYTTTYKEFGDKLYMVFKINEYNDTKWNDLTDEDLNVIGKSKEELTEEIKAELFDAKMSTSFINSQITELVNDLIKNNKIEIYDPVLALNFQTKFSDYEYTTKTLDSTTAVAKVDGTEIKVDDFFKIVSQYFGAPAAFDYFTNIALSNSSYMDKLTEEDLEAAQDSFDAEIKNFKNNTYASSGITSEFTEEQFLLMTLGYDNEGDALKYYYEPLQAYQYVTSNYNDNYFELLSLIGQNNYNNYFSLDINHALLYVDYDLDGSMDNPKDFLLSLEKDSPELVDDFKQTIVNIYSAIYNEVNYLQLGAEEGLKYMVKAYNENRTLHSPENKGLNWNTFADVKISEGTNFNILLKVEDLGVVDTSNASNYVSEFSDHVRDMYENLKQEVRDDLGYEADDEDDKDLLKEFEDFLDQDHLEEITTTTSFDDICMSTFGFHMLLSTKGSISTSAVFLASSDYKQNVGDEFKIYESIDINLNDTDLNVNAYSETAYPSINQLQIYVAQKDTDDGIQDLKSATETIINNFYSTFESRFSDNTFRNYYLYKELNMNIQFTNSTIEVNKWFDINKDMLDNYADTTTGSGHMYAGMWDLVDTLFTEEN